MKIKKSYVLNTADKNVLESAIQILDVYAYEDNIELEGLTKGNIEYFAKRLVSIGKRILAMKKLAYETEEIDSEPDGDGEPVAMCEYCGALMYEDDTQWVAANGAICCCDECVIAFNKELGEYDEDDE